MRIDVGLTSAVIAAGCVIIITLYKYKRRIREAINSFDYLNIKIVNNETACKDAVNEIRRRCLPYKALGFDCEWVTIKGKRRPIALLQFSSLDGFCVLFRLSQIKTIPECLKDLLEDDSIYKVGVAPLDDAQYLFADYSVSVRATLDLRHIAVKYGLEARGLSALSKSLLRVNLDKNWKVRCSDWEADFLTERQIKYAAIDAHVAIKIYEYFLKNHTHAALWKFFSRRLDLQDEDILCRKFKDVRFKMKSHMKDNKQSSKNGGSKKKYSHATRSKPLYDNCLLEAPDGELLCTCEKKKALWYVEKELADVVDAEPMRVRLRFEPAGRSVGSVGEYYKTAKSNICVVCGAAESYIRKNVVPREYRKHFPEIMKDHSSHDVVLLCAPCHQRSNRHDLTIRERLAEQFDAPLAERMHNRYSEDANLKKIRSAARALLYQSKIHTLPEKRKKELEDIILHHFVDHYEITKELLEEAATLDTYIEKADYEAHGLKVVEQFAKQDGGLLSFEEMWRDQFLTSMQPRHLPVFWSVKHNRERLLVKHKEGRLSTEDTKLLGENFMKF